MADLIDRDALLLKQKAHADLFADSTVHDDIVRRDEATAALAEIINASTVNRWISCSERLPNEAGEYLVCGRWGEEKPKTWICQFKIFVDIGGFVNSAKNPPVSFWMQMPPDAYKQPEKE